MKGVNVEVMGQNLVVASDADDEWVKAVAEAVDSKIRSIRAGSQTANSVNLAILAALNFADELERLKREHRELIGQIEAMSRKVADMIGPNDPQGHRQTAGQD
jgi:cell division protein ZapA